MALRPRHSVAFLVLLAKTAWADAVPAPPTFCGLGEQATSDHQGAYCRPKPPTDCPPGYEGRVARDVQYCEPPPDHPCPVGSRWGSLDATSALCIASEECGLRPCDDGTCVPTSFCVRELCFRCMAEQVAGLCRTQSDCGQGTICRHVYRCEPPTQRVAPGYTPSADRPPRLPAPLRPALTFPTSELAHCGEPQCPDERHCRERSCGEGFGCHPLDFCVELAAGTSYGGPTPKVTAVSGFCDEQGQCPPPAVCSRLFRCVPDTAWPEPPPPAAVQTLPRAMPPVALPPPRCGCHHGQAVPGAAHGWLWLFFGVLALRLRRALPTAPLGGRGPTTTVAP
jgi:hypothetical protein